MKCEEFIEGVRFTALNLLVLMGVTVYRCLFFMTFLSASIGPSYLLCWLFDSLTGFGPSPQAAEGIICMVFIKYWAEFSVGVEERVCGNLFDYYKTKFPNTMTFGRLSINFVLYVTSFCQLFIQFEAVHTYPSHLRTKRHSEFVPEQDKKAAEIEKRNFEWHVSMFLLALAYLTFTTSRAIHKHVLRVVRNLPAASYSILSNCMIRIGFGLLHLLVNTIYFLPCVAIAYTARTYKTAGHTTFFQICFTAGLSGMIAALFELNKPWPRDRGQLPLLPFENNLIAKDNLTMVLTSFILIFFYRPSDKVAENMFDSTNHDLVLFTISVAFTVLHVVKLGVHSILTLAHDYDTLIMRQDRLMYAENAPPIQQQGSSTSRGSRRSPSPRRHEIGPNGMCQRCTENLLNNNTFIPQPFQAPPPTAPLADNNNEAPPPQQSKPSLPDPIPEPIPASNQPTSEVTITVELNSSDLQDV